MRETSTPPISDTTHGQLIDAALQSETFQNSPVAKVLLKYLWAHRHESLGEYAIALDALGRRTEFDPKTDSYVRVQISRLRAKLAEFTAKEGKNFDTQILLPRGGYALEFVDSRKDTFHAEETEDDGLSPESPGHQTDHLDAIIPRSGSALIPLLTFTIGVLFVAVGLLTWTLWGRHSAGIPSTGALVPGSSQAFFWRHLLSTTKPIHIVVPNPVFFEWKDPRTSEELKVRAVGVNEFDGYKTSEELSPFTKLFGTPKLSQDYLGAYDALSAFTLTSFLQQSGMPSQVSDGAGLAVGAVDRENLVLMGTVQTLRPYSSYMQRMTLTFTPVTQTVVEKSPTPSKPVEFKPITESPDRTVVPQLLACLPTGSPEGRLIVIEGFKNGALVNYIISNEGQNDLQRLQTAHGSSPFFEAVVMSELNGSIPLRSWISSYRPISAVP